MSSKLIGCNIYGHVRVHPHALRIVDTPEFQRLKYIKQLGLCHHIFPAAEHSRFVHSIGTYHLAGKVLDRLKELYPNKLYDIMELGGSFELTPKISEMIKIAGLCHDIGHGPFSHIFDDIILKDSIHPNKTHEVRSCLITEIICKRELATIFNDNDINFIKSLINPNTQHTGVLYQIVSNYLNGIDVDKFDYLVRDAYNLGLRKGFNPCRLIDEIIIDNNDNISYPKHCSSDILDMFYTRYIMHKQIYTHKTVKKIECMVFDMLRKVDNIYGITNSITDMDKFCKLTDENIFYRIINSTMNEDCHPEIMDAYKIYTNIINRNLYQLIIDTTDIGLLPKINKLVGLYDCLEIVTTNIGFVGGNYDPFENVFFYDNPTNGNTFTIDRNIISGILSSTYQETRILLLCKDKAQYSVIMENWLKK